MIRFLLGVVSLLVVHTLITQGYGLFVLMATLFAGIAGLSLAGVYGFSALVTHGASTAPHVPQSSKELKMFRFWCVVLSLVVVYALVAHGYGLFVLMGTIFAAIAGLSLAGIYGMSAWMRRADAPRKPPRWYSYPDPHVHRLDP